jgi:hypothetical protein
MKDNGHGWQLKLLAAFVFIVVYPGLIIFVAHRVEIRTAHAREAQTTRIAKTTDFKDCQQYNNLAFAQNDFQGTLRSLLIAARDTRKKEAAALKGKGASSRAKKIRTADLQAVRAYNRLLAGVHVVEYKKGCPIPKRRVSRPPRKIAPSPEDIRD